MPVNAGGNCNAGEYLQMPPLYEYWRIFAGAVQKSCQFLIRLGRTFESRKPARFLSSRARLAACEHCLQLATSSRNWMNFDQHWDHCIGHDIIAAGLGHLGTLEDLRYRRLTEAAFWECRMVTLVCWRGKQGLAAVVALKEHPFGSWMTATNSPSPEWSNLSAYCYSGTVPLASRLLNSPSRPGNTRPTLDYNFGARNILDYND